VDLEKYKDNAANAESQDVEQALLGYLRKFNCTFNS